MASQRRSGIALLVVCFLLATAGVSYAASSTFTAPGKLSGNQKSITSPCSSVTVDYAPTYSTTDGTYATDHVTVTVICPVGDYQLSLALATGASSYVEKIQPFSTPSSAAYQMQVTLPSRVKAGDLSNIAAYIVAQ